VTHSFNQNQSMRFLTFSQTQGGLNITAPISGTACPPGHYMLFILNTNGVPSVAKIVNVNLPSPLSVNQSATYKIVANHSGKVLDVEAYYQYADGGNIQQWDYLGGLNQQWRFQTVGGGYYNIVSNISGKCLDVRGGDAATGNGIQLQQWTCHGGDNQKWGIYPAGGNSVKIIAKNSGKAIDVDGGATANGAKVQQFMYLGYANQQWQLVTIP